MYWGCRPRRVGASQSGQVFGIVGGARVYCRSVNQPTTQFLPVATSPPVTRTRAPHPTPPHPTRPLARPPAHPVQSYDAARIARARELVAALLADGLVLLELAVRLEAAALLFVSVSSVSSVSSVKCISHQHLQYHQYLYQFS